VRRPVLALLSLAAVGGALLVAPSSGAAAKAPLGFGKNTYAYTADYGEPGIAVAPSGTIYVTTPGDGGAVLARSDNKGRSWVKLPTARTRTQYASTPRTSTATASPSSAPPTRGARSPSRRS
jgi:hypothetical protein